jgi:hypothetical protein
VGGGIVSCGERVNWKTACYKVEPVPPTLTAMHRCSPGPLWSYWTTGSSGFISRSTLRASQHEISWEFHGFPWQYPLVLKVECIEWSGPQSHILKWSCHTCQYLEAAVCPHIQEEALREKTCTLKRESPATCIVSTLFIAFKIYFYWCMLIVKKCFIVIFPSMHIMYLDQIHPFITLSHLPFLF